MAGFYGNPVARYVRQGIAKVNNVNWTPLFAGTAELENRQWVKIQPRGRDTIRMAIKYVVRNADGTFTAPTDSAHTAIIYPTTSIIEEPIGDSVRIYARGVQNGGSSGGFKVVIAEYA